MASTPPSEVAVVGTGMAGLVTAYLLHHDAQQRFRVRLVDKISDVSLSAESIAVPATTSQDSNTSAHWIDVPMRAFAGGFYQNLVRMYDYLGVNYRSQSFLFSFARIPRPSSSSGAARPYMVHASNFHQIPPIPRGGLLHWIIEASYVVLCYLYFTICCFLIAPRHFKSGDVESLDDYLRRIRLPAYYVANYVLPMISSVCTCSHPELLRFPASDVLAYKRLTHRQPHFVVTDGVRTVQEKLLHGLDVRLNVQSTQVTPSGDGVHLTTRLPNGQETTERFDLVILAVSPDAAASIFAPVRSVLQEVPTTTVQTTAHTDVANIRPETDGTPAGRRPASPGQQIFFRTNDAVTEAVHVQSNSVLVTTNPLTPIDPEKVLRSASFTRVLRSPRSRRLLNEVFRETQGVPSSGRSTWRNGDGGVYLTGGWCWDGMVLLEGCVVSAMRVASSLGVEVPWQAQ